MSKDEQLNESHLTNKNNILFHVGRNGIAFPKYGLEKDVHIVTLYHGQDSRTSSPARRGTEATLPETVIKAIQDNDEIELTFEIIDPRFSYGVDVTGFGKREFGDEEGQDQRDISEFLNNVFLVAWGDRKECEVEFSDIKYKTFYRSNDWLKKGK